MLYMYNYQSYLRNKNARQNEVSSCLNPARTLPQPVTAINSDNYRQVADCTKQLCKQGVEKNKDTHLR